MPVSEIRVPGLEKIPAVVLNLSPPVQQNT